MFPQSRPDRAVDPIAERRLAQPRLPIEVGHDPVLALAHFVSPSCSLAGYPLHNEAKKETRLTDESD